MYNRVLELLDSKWLIHRDTALSYLPALIAYMCGQNVASLFAQTKPERFSRPFVLKKTASGWEDIQPKKSETDPFEEEDDFFSDPELPDHSVAVIPIQGPIFSWKSLDLINHLNKAKENDKIISVLFAVNSPGGQVFMTDIASEAIKQFPKPKVGMIMNMAASAAMWMISGMDYRIATSKMDQIGSIGVYTSFTDMQGFLKEKLNITITDIYATLSTRKNEMIRALREGNQEPIIKDLDFVNEIFHSTIRENLGIESSSEVFTGAIYNSIEAQNHGLINEVNTMEYAFLKAYDEGLAFRMNQLSYSFKS